MSSLSATTLPPSFALMPNPPSKRQTPPNHPVAVRLALKVRGRAGVAPCVEAGPGDRPVGAGSACARLVADVDPIIPGPGEAGVAVIGRRRVAAVGIVVIPPAP